MKFHGLLRFFVFCGVLIIEASHAAQPKVDEQTIGYFKNQTMWEKLGDWWYGVRPGREKKVDCPMPKEAEPTFETPSEEIQYLRKKLQKCEESRDLYKDLAKAHLTARKPKPVKKHDVHPMFAIEEQQALTHLKTYPRQKFYVKNTISINTPVPLLEKVYKKIIKDPQLGTVQIEIGQKSLSDPTQYTLIARRQVT